MPTLPEIAEQEIRVRHDAFVTWFTGQGDEGVIADILASFAPGMALVSPDGTVLGGNALPTVMREGRGKRGADFTIVVEDVEPLWTEGDAVLMGYIERQTIDGEKTARRSTALFSRDETAPLGIVWHHVHETWIDA